MNNYEKRKVIVTGYYSVMIEKPIELIIEEGTNNWVSYVDWKLKNFTQSDYVMNNGYGFWNYQNFSNLPEDVDSLIYAKEIFILKNNKRVLYTPPETRFKNIEESSNYFNNLFCR